MVRSYLRILGLDGRIYSDQTKNRNDAYEFITCKNPKDEYVIELTTDTKYNLEMEPISYKDNKEAGIRIKFTRIKKADM